MPYVGNEPTSNFASVTKDAFSGDGSTTAFTLSKAATTNGVAVFVENVRQEPTTAYAVSGTTLTFTAAPVSASGNNIYVLHHNAPASTATHPAAQALTATSGTFSGVLKTDDTTEATSTTDGSLQTDGGLSVAKDAVIGDNLSLLSDTCALNFGADSDITITHNADKGLILSSGSSGATADVNADELVIQGSGRAGISILTPNANDSQLAFGSPADGLGAFLSYKQSTAAMSIGTSLANGILLLVTGDGAEKAKLTSTGFFKVRGSATSYDGGTSNYHEFLTDEASAVGFVVQSTNSSYSSRLSQFDLPPSDSNTNAKFISCYSSNPGGSADLEFYVRNDGQVYADGSFNAGGADYAEFFEWKDGNTSDENRVGCSVVLDGNKIRKATGSDNTSNIIGVISVNPSVVGDADGEYWQGTYLKDDFGKYIFKDSEQIEWTDKEDVQHSYQKDYIPSDVTVPSDAKKTPIKVRTLNPNYDKSKTYERREDRKEWSYVGMMGKLRMLKGQPTGDRWIKMRDISDTVEEWLVR